MKIRDQALLSLLLMLICTVFISRAVDARTVKTPEPQYATEEKQDAIETTNNAIQSAVEGATPAGSNIIGQVKITDGTNNPDIVSTEGDKSLRVVPGLSDSFSIHLTASAIAAEEAFMLIDLSDTGNWDHTNTGHVNIHGLVISLQPNTAFRGDVVVGFLTNVDDANGDMNVLIGWHFKQISGIVDLAFSTPSLQFEGNVDRWFGPTRANNTNFQTDVNLDGPDGNTSYPSGDGDIVLLIERTAGTIDAGITLFYRTIE